MFQEILALVLAPTLIVGAAAYILRTLFQQGLQRDIEKFKARLQNEHNTAQATLQTQLQAQLFEHQARFSTFHAKQSEVLGKTYELLFDPYEHIREYVHPLDVNGPPSQEKLEQIVAEFNELTGFYHKNRIYLPENICTKMDSLLREMKSALHQNVQARRWELPGTSIELWQNSWLVMENRVPPLMTELEQEFRQNISLGKFTSDSPSQGRVELEWGGIQYYTETPTWSCYLTRTARPYISIGAGQQNSTVKCRKLRLE